MPRGAATFRQADVTRVLKAVVAAGLVVSRVEIYPNGKIAITIGASEPVEPTNALDKWMADHARQTSGNQQRP
jgi:hypothetical protein